MAFTNIVDARNYILENDPQLLEEAVTEFHQTILDGAERLSKLIDNPLMERIWVKWVATQKPDEVNKARKQYERGIISLSCLENKLIGILSSLTY